MVSSELGACEWFVWDLRRSGLIDRGHLDQVVGEFLKRNARAEPPALADYLVSQNILSPFQAERILQGKTQGLVLGPYLLIDSIGSGSMGQVFKASSKTDNQQFAVKVLPRRSMWNVRLARRQVRAFSQFSHPAVVPFIDVGTSGGQHYLVWPLVQGESLESKVQREGRLTPEIVGQIFGPVAAGLAISHQNGLFHGLIKPSNIMVTPENHGKLLDFGIGSLLVENENESLVDTMSTANTLTSGLDCSSPECIMEPTTRTPAGDQYSLGCVIYFALAGRYPFPDGTAVEKMMAHQFKQPVSLREVAPHVPEGLVAIVERLMQKAPESRYHTTDELVEALTPFVQAAPRANGLSNHGNVRGNSIHGTRGGSVHIPPRPAGAQPPAAHLPPSPVPQGAPLPGYSGPNQAFPAYGTPPAPAAGNPYATSPYGSSVIPAPPSFNSGPTLPPAPYASAPPVQPHSAAGPAPQYPGRGQFAARPMAGAPTMASMEFPPEALMAEPYVPPYPMAPNGEPYQQPQVTPAPGGRVQNLPAAGTGNWSEPVRTPVVGPLLIFLVAALVTGVVYLLGKNFLFPT